MSATSNSLDKSFSAALDQAEHLYQRHVLRQHLADLNVQWALEDGEVPPPEPVTESPEPTEPTPDLGVAKFSYPPSRLASDAFHECGHAVTAILLGVEVDAVEHYTRP